MKAERNRAASDQRRKASGHPSARDRIEAPGSSASTDINGDLRAQISGRAFERYVQRGFQDGHDLEDWLEAEREILRQEDRAEREIVSQY
jgi:hypothetical protein